METSALFTISFALALAFVGGLLFERLHLPKLVGYITVGAVFGPHVLGLLHETDEVVFLAGLGLVLLMFVLGIEIDNECFGEHLSKAFFIALVQVAIGVALMWVIGALLQWSVALRIVLGCVVALSSTAVALGIFDSLRIHNTPIAGFTAAVLIAQDILVAPMLIVVSAISGEALSLASLARAGFSILLVFAVLAVILYLARHEAMRLKFERLLMNGMGQPVIAGSALCFGAAAITGFLGLSTAFGAFAAGFLIGNTSHGDFFRRAVQPLHDMLLMIFFLSVGLLVSLPFVFERLLDIALAVVAVFLLKTFFNYALLRIAGETRAEALVASASLAQIGEFGFALIALALAGGVIVEREYHLVLSVIVLSLMLAPLWLAFLRRRAAILGTLLSGWT